MRKSWNKIVAGAREARSFARDECEHDWEYLTKEPNFELKKCRKCLVRLTGLCSNEPADTGSVT
jgi:hypothetical protein